MTCKNDVLVNKLQGRATVIGHGNESNMNSRIQASVQSKLALTEARSNTRLYMEIFEHKVFVA